MAGNNSKNKFVVDSSFILSFLLDEKNTDTEAVFKRFTDGEVILFAPMIIDFEVGNALRTCVLQKKLTAKKALAIYKVYFDLLIELDSISYEKTLKMAIQKKLSFYDASYVYLSHAKKLPLLSLDKRLLTL